MPCSCFPCGLNSHHGWGWSHYCRVVVEVLILHETSSDTAQEGGWEGALLVGVEVQAPPHVVHWHWRCEQGGACCYLVGMKVLVSYLTFSGTIQGKRELRGWGSPHYNLAEVQVPPFHSSFASVDGGRGHSSFCGVWSRAGVERVLSKHFCLARLLLAWFFGWREQAFIEVTYLFIFLHLLVFPGCCYFSSKSWMYEGKKKLRKLTTVSFLGPWGA